MTIFVVLSYILVNHLTAYITIKQDCSSLLCSESRDSTWWISEALTLIPNILLLLHKKLLIIIEKLSCWHCEEIGHSPSHQEGGRKIRDLERCISVPHWFLFGRHEQSQSKVQPYVQKVKIYGGSASAGQKKPWWFWRKLFYTSSMKIRTAKYKLVQVKILTISSSLIFIAKTTPQNRKS